MTDPVTTPGAITPETVPEEWVKAALAHYSMHGAGLIRNILAGVYPLIAAQGAAAERERQRSLLPYHIPCCDRFADAVADLINEHEDTP